MPDQDIVARSLRKPWKPAYRISKGDCSPEFVAQALSQALAAVTRDENGLPALEPIWTATAEAAARPGSARSLAEMVRRVEQRFGQQTASKILARSALASYAQIEAGRALPSPQALVEAYLRSRVEVEFFSKVRYRLVGPKKRFSDASAEQSFMSEVRRQVAPVIEKLAKSLVRDPSASRLRAPRSAIRQRTTAELVDEPLRESSP